ncbi:AAA family ATPase [Kamptonema animale CS-326]|jgi:predicted ATPase/serine phosphatase RsbU (regulator of sigma subunit)|uniref:AAA family ATPase n=1 Tax=Kamptonema animale TaxID=92934 RepID=UPI002330873B|nr:AAA family ATPase [Kamptonema animale]MDB9514153.1 AAA family ATPase [Kamptonema animale CS-326]
MSPIVSLPDYQIVEQLYAGTRTLIYRGIRTSDRQPVVIKVLRNEYQNFNGTIQLWNQYTISKNLEFPSINKPLALENYRNGYALVMEDFGGISLSDYLKIANGERSTSKYLPLGEFLEVAIQLAEILHYLYQNRVLHKDIKPANILIHPQSKKIKLIDFSIASLLPRETQEIQTTKDLEGTLAYLSPEQTGRMNRGIDYRSDFYCLGITFYELLTGSLPCTSEDAMELVHYHLAKQPIPIHQVNSENPVILSEIVSKLIAKNAEDRYQSALGIKHDLELCLAQLQTKGTIEFFEIGKRDISDRFTIPEKLYGRETEVKQLLSAFDRVVTSTAEMMLVAGFSGIGKTAVVNEVHKPIVRQRGYFIKGKYDQFQRNIPFSAFVQAFRDLMGQVLSESDEQLPTWTTNLLSAVGDNGQVLIDVIPELENIIGKQPPALELSGTAAQNRFNLLFQKFVQVFTSQARPLVIFLDDLQWADSASLDLLKILVQDTGHLLILGAYRDNEVSPVHPFILTVDEIIKTGATVNTITLKTLRETDLNRLVADTLNCELSLAQPLTKLVYQKSQGNPFFATQFLKALHNEELISFNWEIQNWQCDIVQVNDLAITDDIVEFMGLQLQKLPIPTQDALKLAACMGAQFDLHTLAIVSQQSEIETATLLWRALQEGLILPISNVYKFYQFDGSNCLSSEEETSDRQIARYRFLHDRVQQAAYSLIPSDQKQATHLRIGQLLQQNLPKIEKEEKLFDIVGHLNLGIELMTQAEERAALARLNLAAGQKARNSTAYSAARSFVQTGINLLSTNCWQTQYELALHLYVAGTETAYLNGDFESMEEMAAEVLLRATTILDKVKIYEIQIAALTAQSQTLEAIARGQEILAELGVEFSAKSDEALTSKMLNTLVEQLQGKQIEELVNLPEMSDRQTTAAMQLLAMLLIPTFQGNSALLPLLCATMASLSLQFGNAPASTIGYVGYGMVLSTFLREVEKGYYFGRLAMSLLNQLNVQELKPLTLLWFGGFIQHHKEALRATILTLKDGYLAGIETGDFLNAGYNIIVYFNQSYFAGRCLADWVPEIENYEIALAQMKQDSPLMYLKMQKQTAHNLIETLNQPDLLSGPTYDERVMLPKLDRDNELTAIACTYIYKLTLAYFFGNYNNALNYIAKANLYVLAVAPLIFKPVFHFYAGLTYLALLPTQSEIEQANTFALVETHQDTVAKWAHHSPANHEHKFALIEAEKCRVLGKNYEAGDWFDRAITLAKENEYIQEEALANELAAKFYLTWGKEKVAAGYIQEAYHCYNRWGAKAKLAHLEQHYPQFLAAILEPINPALISGETISPTVKISVTSTNSSHNQNLELDFTAVMKAAQAISQEIELDKFLATLMQIAIASAGAESGTLAIYQETRWLVVVRASQNFISHVQIPLAESQELPKNLIYSVARSQTTAVFDNLSLSKQFAGDRYIINHQPKSALCTPISDRGKVIAILYLENNLTVGAFTSDRLEVVRILSAQAAISIENALLYRTLEQKVIDRTTQLAAANEEITLLNERLKAENMRMAAELDITRQLQQMMLPKKEELRQITGLDIAGFMQPADEVGGDYYDVLQQNDSVKICIGDVTGHGLESGVLTIVVQAAVRALIENGETDSNQFLKVLNRTVYKNVQRMNSDKSLTFLLMDYCNGKVRFSGQHEEAIVARASGEIERIDTMDLGFPIGLEEDISEFLSYAEVQLHPGDVVVLYSDGITEAENLQKQHYEMERLLEVIRRNSHRSASEIREAAIEDVHRYIGEQKVFDDITLLVLKQK